MVFSLASYRVSKDKNASLPRAYDPSYVSRLQESLQELGKTISRTGAFLVLIDDMYATCKYPSLNYEFLILEKGHLERCTIDRSVAIKDRADFTMALKTSAAAYANIFYYDFANDFCNQEICSVIDPQTNRLLYSDNRNHFTATNPDPLKDQMMRILGELKN